MKDLSMKDDPKNLVGRIVFFKMADAVFEIVEILPDYDPPVAGNGLRMKLRDLGSGEESDPHWINEIGEEFILISEDYPKDKIQFYARWVKDRDKAHDIHMEFLEMAA